MLRNNLIVHLAKYLAFTKVITLRIAAVYGNSSHFFVRNSPKISPPPPRNCIPVCKKFSCNYYEIDAIGIYIKVNY